MELKTFNPLLLRLLLHLRHLHLWLSKLETHLQTQRGRLLAMCWARPLALQQSKVLRAQLLLLGLVRSLGQKEVLQV